MRADATVTPEAQAEPMAQRNAELTRAAEPAQVQEQQEMPRAAGGTAQTADDEARPTSLVRMHVLFTT